MPTTTTTGLRPLVLPLYGTPRNEDRETLGPEVGDVAARLGLPPMPHQQHIFDVAFELDPDTGGFVYDEVHVWVMRQVGKTLGILLPVMVHRCTLMDDRRRRQLLPGRHGRQLVSFTMQKRDKARKKLEVDMIPMLSASPHFTRILNPKARPTGSTRQWKSSLNNGSEHLQFGPHNYLHIGTPSADSGHGDTLDVGVADEVRFYVDDSVEAAYRPSQATRPNAQLWEASTAGNEKSLYMWPKVLADRQALEQGRPSKIASFEYAIPEGADLTDPAVWFEHHPAVGRTIGIDFVLGELDKAMHSPDESKLDTFRQEYANQWVRTPVLSDGVRIRVIPAEAVTRATVPDGTKLVGEVAMAVDVSPDGASASITIAGRTADGLPVVDVLTFEGSTFWLEPRIAQHRDAWQPKVIGYHGQYARALAPEIGRGAGVVPVKELPATDFAAACEAFVIATNADPPRLGLLANPSLLSAIDGATKLQRGGGWVWDRQTALADICPLVSATVALRLLEMVPPEPPPTRTVAMVLGGAGRSTR
jgi:hypothetical protein